MITVGSTVSCGCSLVVYKCAVAPKVHLGHLIRLSREERGWSQEKLGTVAGGFKLTAKDKPINKSTISSLESDPFSSGVDTLWRVMAALGLSFADLEPKLDSPFIGKPRAPSEAKTG